MYQDIDRGQVVSILEEAKLLLDSSNDEIVIWMKDSVARSIDLIRGQFWFNPNDVPEALLGSYETLRRALIHSLMLAFVNEDHDFSCYQVLNIPFTSRFQVVINYRTPDIANISRYSRIKTLIWLQAELKEATERCEVEKRGGGTAY